MQPFLDERVPKKRPGGHIPPRQRDRFAYPRQIQAHLVQSARHSRWRQKRIVDDIVHVPISHRYRPPSSRSFATPDNRISKRTFFAQPQSPCRPIDRERVALGHRSGIIDEKPLLLHGAFRHLRKMPFADADIAKLRFHPEQGTERGERFDESHAFRLNARLPFKIRKDIGCDLGIQARCFWRVEAQDMRQDECIGQPMRHMESAADGKTRRQTRQRR